MHITDLIYDVFAYRLWKLEPSPSTQRLDLYYCCGHSEAFISCSLCQRLCISFSSLFHEIIKSDTLRVVLGFTLNYAKFFLNLWLLGLIYAVYRTQNITVCCFMRITAVLWNFNHISPPSDKVRYKIQIFSYFKLNTRIEERPAVPIKSVLCLLRMLLFFWCKITHFNKKPFACLKVTVMLNWCHVTVL